MSPWKPEAPRGWGLCTGTRHLPEICHVNGWFCIFCIHRSPPASRSRPKPTPPPPAKGVAWRTEMSAQDKFQISMYSGSFKHSVLKLKKKKKDNSRSSQHMDFQCSSPDRMPSKSEHSSPPGISLHCHPGIPLLSTQSWISCFLHPTDIYHS